MKFGWKRSSLNSINGSLQAKLTQGVLCGAMSAGAGHDTDTRNTPGRIPVSCSTPCTRHNTGCKFCLGCDFKKCLELLFLSQCYPPRPSARPGEPSDLHLLFSALLVKNEYCSTGFSSLRGHIMVVKGLTLPLLQQVVYILISCCGAEWVNNTIIAAGPPAIPHILPPALKWLQET